MQHVMAMMQVPPIEENGWKLWVLYAVVGFFPLLYFVLLGVSCMYARRCPKCSKFFALRVEFWGQRGSRQELVVTKRMERILDPYGNCLGVIEREQPEVVNSPAWVRRYACRYCGHRKEEIS